MSTMQRRTLIIIITAVLLLFGFYILSAVIARKKQQELLAKFNEVNKELNVRRDSFGNEPKIADAQKNFPVEIMNRQIILLIDSLKAQYEAPDKSQQIAGGLKLREDIKRLLHYIQQVNKFKWDAVDSTTPDTIQYWLDATTFNEEKWLSTFFLNEPKELAITYLNYLRNQAISNKIAK